MRSVVDDFGSDADAVLSDDLHHLKADSLLVDVCGDDAVPPLPCLDLIVKALDAVALLLLRVEDKPDYDVQFCSLLTQF